jgi:DeoR/GlpR family transcriptional regulator of sugar metabolism
MLMRSWDILVLLRARPRTLHELARACGVCERTIRRDLEALCVVGFPVTCSRDAVDTDRAWEVTWALAAIPEWPRRERTPLSRRAAMRQAMS